MTQIFRFIQYCMDNRSFVDTSGSFQMPEEADENLVHQLAQLRMNEDSLFEADMSEDVEWRPDEQ